MTSRWVRSHVLALVGFLLSPTSATTQQAASGLSLDATRLHMGLDSLAVYLIRGADTVRTGTLWDELRIVQEDGRSRLERIYRSMDQVLGARVDTIVDDVPTLTPVRLRSRSTRGMEILDYAPDGVHGWIRLANGDSANVQTSVPKSVYGSASFDLVLRAAPLEKDWQAEVRAFIPSTRTVVPLRARVVGVEMIGNEACWRVDADFAGTAVTFWIAQQTRRLCQQVMHLQPGVQILFGRFPSGTAPPVQTA